MRKICYPFLFSVVFLTTLVSSCKKDETIQPDSIVAAPVVAPVVDSKAPTVSLASPSYGAMLRKEQIYTIRGTAADDVELYQVIVQIRQKNTNTYIFDKTITLPVSTKGYNIVENFSTPSLTTPRSYTVIVIGIDKTNKKTAISSEISVY